MSSLAEISDAYIAGVAACKKEREATKAKLDRAKKLVDKLKADLNAMRWPNWLDHLVKPLAEALLPFFPGATYSIHGPFGMDCETSIDFERKGCKTRRLVLIVGNLGMGKLLIRDVSKNTGSFASGSIGEVNGMNHPSVLMTDMSLETIAKKWVR